MLRDNSGIKSVAFVVIKCVRGVCFILQINTSCSYNAKQPSRALVKKKEKKEKNRKKEKKSVEIQHRRTITSYIVYGDVVQVNETFVH